jgi:large subunit ribosomal protein L30
MSKQQPQQSEGSQTQEEKMVRVTLVRSPIGSPERQKRTVRTLGLRRMHRSVEHIDSPSLRGMIAKVIHLVEVEELGPVELRSGEE